MWKLNKNVPLIFEFKNFLVVNSLVRIYPILFFDWVKKNALLPIKILFLLFLTLYFPNSWKKWSTVHNGGIFLDFLNKSPLEFRIFFNIFIKKRMYFRRKETICLLAKWYFWLNKVIIKIFLDQTIKKDI